MFDRGYLKERWVFKMLTILSVFTKSVKIECCCNW